MRTEKVFLFDKRLLPLETQFFSRFLEMNMLIMQSVLNRGSQKAPLMLVKFYANAFLSVILVN